MVVRANGVVDHLEIGGPVLGLLGSATYDYGHTSLQPGDILMMCSDGVTEARNVDGDEFGGNRLATLLRDAHGHDPEAVLERVLAAVREFAGREPQTDDITALVLALSRIKLEVRSQKSEVSWTHVTRQAPSSF